MKKISIFVVIVIFITCLAGCGGGGSNDDERPVTNPGILGLLDKYEKAVEAYDVDKMLECLDSSNFALTINEGSYNETKNYTQLETELREDNEEDTQRTWRKSKDEGGNGYVLDLALGTPTSNNETSSGAIVKQTFEVYESAVIPVISKFRSDSGTIVWTLAQNSGEWKATAMVINYTYSASLSSMTKPAAVAFKGSNDNGFGFGRVGF